MDTNKAAVRELIEAAKDHLLHACTSERRLRDAISATEKVGDGPGVIPEDSLMALMHAHLYDIAIRVTTVERWKDGIEIESPSSSIKKFAQAVREWTPPDTKELA